MRDASEPSVAPSVGRTGELIRGAAPALVFLAVRGVGLIVLWLMAWVGGTDPIEELNSWDGVWLVDIAEHGYAGLDRDTHVDAFGNSRYETPYGFFPGYPMAVSAVRFVGFDKVAAGLVVSLLAGVAAAYALVRLAELVPGGTRRAGLVFVALFASAPMAVALSMTYTEALFCALAAWALVHLLRERWIAAAACCSLAGLVRPTALALIIAVVSAIVAATWRGTTHPRQAAAAALLAPVGLAGYLVHVWAQTGSPDGWFGVQERGWGWSFDFGIGALDEIGAILTTDPRLFDAVQVGTILAYLAMLGVSFHQRIPWPLTVYAVGVIAMTLCASGVITTTRARYLIPAFVVLLPVALALSKRRTGTVLIALASAALVSAWFGGYALVFYRAVI
jgi:hypothetical protein